VGASVQWRARVLCEGTGEIQSLSPTPSRLRIRQARGFALQRTRRATQGADALAPGMGSYFRGGLLPSGRSPFDGTRPAQDVAHPHCESCVHANLLRIAMRREREDHFSRLSASKFEHWPQDDDAKSYRAEVGLSPFAAASSGCGSNSHPPDVAPEVAENEDGLIGRRDRRRTSAERRHRHIARGVHHYRFALRQTGCTGEMPCSADATNHRVRADRRVAGAADTFSPVVP
jgi:hypothetical protein